MPLLWVAVLLSVRPLSAQRGTGRIAGRVTTEAGTPLAGADVLLPGTEIGVLSRADGRYIIPGVPAGPHRVRASLIGYAAAEAAAVEVRPGETVLVDLALRAQAVELEQLVATGYGMARRRDLTGAVASASGDAVALEAAPTSAVTELLQGRFAGVQVIHDSGIPGAGMSVRVRGTNSISANAEPLYVVDDLPAFQGTTSTDPAYNPLNLLDPGDIESIDILKDASATAIYGARGANGVVLIRTKRGRPVENRITVTSSYGLQQIGKRVPVLNAREFMSLVNEARVNAGKAPKYPADSLAAAQTYDWPGMMLRTAPQLAESITMSGGDARTRYLLAADLARQNGIVVGSGFERYGVRLNLDREISDRVRLSTGLSLTRVRQADSRVENSGSPGGTSGMLAATEYNPHEPPRDTSGRWTLGTLTGPVENPLAKAIEMVNERRDSRALGTVALDLDAGRGLRLRSALGGNLGFWRDPYFAPRTTARGSTVGGDASVFSGQSTELTNENQVSYHRLLPADQALEVVAGFSAQSSHYEDATAAAQGFPSDATGWNDLYAGATMRPASASTLAWTLLSYLGRANYSVADRYLLTVTARRDGSSRFGANHKWAFFPSAAFAWRASEEPFLKGRLGPVGDLKLRVSYGRTGNQAIAEYQSLALLGTSFYALGADGSERPALAPRDTQANPGLKWETTNQLDLGLDAALLHDRVSLSLDAYHSVTHDLLLAVPQPATSGYASQLQNVGSVRNDGLELSVTTVNVERKRFGWRSVLTAAGNRDKVLSLGGVSAILPGGGRFARFLDGGQSHIVRVGEPLGAIYGFKVNGLWQAGDACYLGKDCTPGEYRVADINGDSVINLNDRTIVGHADPRVYGGFSNSLRYGPLTLDGLIIYTYGNRIADISGVSTALVRLKVNERRTSLDRWRPDHTNTQIPRANSSRPNRLYSTLVEDGSFLRLQTLTLGYTLPRGWLAGAQSARLYLTGQNLFVLTRYSGFDPEVNGFGGDPRMRGIDYGACPRARAYNVGADVTF